MNLEGAHKRSTLATTQPEQHASKRGLRLRVYVALSVIDAFLIGGAFVSGNMFRFNQPFAAGGMNILATILPLYLFTAASRSVYSADIFTRWRHNAASTLAALLVATVAVLLISFYLHATSSMSREVFTLGVCISGILLFISRRPLSRWANRTVGGHHLSEIFIHDGIDPPHRQHLTVYDAANLGLHPDIRDPQMLNRLGHLLHGADRVIIGCPPERSVRWAMALKGANISGEIVAPAIDSLGALGVSQIGDQSTLIISQGALDARNRALKRALDITLALGVLIAVCPIMVAVAISVRLDSSGPIFFRQQRLGRGNRLFSMFKFRSMRADQSDAAGSRSTERDDDRITRVGQIIRTTSIDELPQLLNILKGDMSFVGPRPHALGSLAGDKLFWEIDERYWHRHAAKPGLTGLAQIRGFRGATHFQSDLVDRLQADLEYLNGWSIWRDISILLATVKVVIHRNAY